MKVHGKDMRTTGDFTVHEGETVPFVLTYSPSHLPPPQPVDIAETLTATQGYWREWSERCNATGPYTDIVRRSLITLKALSYQPTGGIVAAVTTSLPEQLGGPRNWDYRYCWLRDATFTLLAFLNAGYREEADRWQKWLMRAIAGSPEQIQIMYGVAGERRLDEWQISWLPGYEKSAPVRIGNAAAQQMQLDIYGELADVLTQADRGGLPTRAAPTRTARSLPRPSGRESGASPTKASGRCAAGRSISSTPRRWPGWRSTAPARSDNNHHNHEATQTLEKQSPTKSTPISARRASIPTAAISCSITAPSTSMPACCCCR